MGWFDTSKFDAPGMQFFKSLNIGQYRFSDLSCFASRAFASIRRKAPATFNANDHRVCSLGPKWKQ